MNDSTSKELNATIVNDFIPRRQAQMYLALFTTNSKEAAEGWARLNIAPEHRTQVQQIVVDKLKKMGYTNVKPPEK